MSSTTRESSSEGVVEQTKGQVGEVASSVQEKAGELKEQGRSKLSETLDERTSQAGTQTRQAASAMRRTGEQMRMAGEPGSPSMAGAFEAVADRVERLGSYLEHTPGDRLLRDVEGLARRQPWVVASIGVAAGLAASRFLKASSERRYGSERGGSSPDVYGRGGNGTAGAIASTEYSSAESPRGGYRSEVN